MKLEEQLYDVKRVAIAGHVKPDGDCVGSTLAVYNYIRKYHPEMEVELHLEPIPNIFKFLANADKIDSSYIEKEPYDLFIALDCGDEKRLGNAVKYFHAAKRTFCVDHHISNQNFADANYIFPEASSTCELVYELIDEEKITKEIAECIYVGIVHDTGVFQYSCTSAKTMNIAGRLMEMGIDFSRIVDKTYYEKTYRAEPDFGSGIGGQPALFRWKMHCIYRNQRRNGKIPGSSETFRRNRTAASCYQRCGSCNLSLRK